jgi:hypothetical protein
VQKICKPFLIPVEGGGLEGPVCSGGCKQPGCALCMCVLEGVCFGCVSCFLVWALALLSSPINIMIHSSPVYLRKKNLLEITCLAIPSH